MSWPRLKFLKSRSNFNVKVTRLLEDWQSQKGPCQGSVAITVTFLVLTLNFDPIPQNVKVHISHQSCIYVWNMKAVRFNYSSYCVRTKVLTKFCCDLDLWPFDPKMYKYLTLTILHLCMTYQSCTLNTTQVIVSEPKRWPSSVVSLTFDLLIPKFINIFLSPSCIYLWNMKAVCWTLPKLSCQNHSVDKFQLWLWALTFWPQHV